MFWTQVTNFLVTVLAAVVGGLLLHVLTKFADRPAHERREAWQRFSDAALLPVVIVLFFAYILMMELGDGPPTRRDVWVGAVSAFNVAGALAIRLVELLQKKLDRVTTADKSG